MKTSARIFLTLALAAASCASCYAQLNANEGRLYTSDNRYIAPTSTNYFIAISGGASMAFGDDSYHVFKDFKNACGWNAGLAVGMKFSDLLTCRAKVRSLRLYSRTNLESLEANRDEFPQLFTRDGFYGYNDYNFSVDAMVDLTHFINKNPERRFHTYLIGGIGLDLATSYDPVVENWKTLVHGPYFVDTDQHTMLSAAVGGQLEYRCSKSIGVNIEALCTFTSDKLEGVVYEENYDAYVTATAGLVLYF